MGIIGLVAKLAAQEVAKKTAKEAAKKTAMGVVKSVAKDNSNRCCCRHCIKRN